MTFHHPPSTADVARPAGPVLDGPILDGSLLDGDRADAPPAGERGTVRLTWQGDLDIASAPVLAAALHVLGAAGRRDVVVDVSAVTFMDCAGLGVFLEADDRLAGGLRLARPSRAVVRLLALVGLADRFATTAEWAAGDADPVKVVERSRGLLMGSFGCTADQATKMLASTAVLRNVQVQVLAGLLVAVTSADLGRQDGPERAVQQLMGCEGAAA